MMFDVGLPELVMILVVALLVFGPGKLPEVGASLGKAIRDFRSATQGISDEIQSVTRLEGPPESEAAMRARLLREIEARQSPAAPAPVALPAAPPVEPAGSVEVSAPENTASSAQAAVPESTSGAALDGVDTRLN